MNGIEKYSTKFGEILVDHNRDNNLSISGIDTLKDRYMMPGERPQHMFARVAATFADDLNHAQRLYDYISRLWFMPATPVLSNGGSSRGLPISCFLGESQDSLQGIVDLWTENVWLAARGGGIGSYWGNLRSIGETVGGVGQTSGIVPFIKVMDSQTLAISQGSLRRGSAAIYLDIEHPEIEEFIEIRKPTGGDPNRKALNVHHGVMITDAFMRAVEEDLDWDLLSPHDGTVMKTVKARDLWIRLLTCRVETGEPYLVFKDTVNNFIPEHHKKEGLFVKTSNLCSEITLPTGPDHLGNHRTAVCCLSSLNLETYDEWCEDGTFIPDVMRFLDNVLSEFIATAPPQMARAVYSASRERSVGLGTMGFHGFLQSKRVPFEGAMAKSWNLKIFKHIKDSVDAINVQLAEERGPCPDAKDAGVMKRFSNCTAIAPTASISIIANNSSPGIEPLRANVFTQKTLTGSHSIKNKWLVGLLEEKGMNTAEVWSSITTNGGSVQHLDFLDDWEKDVFKTAMEIDQMWIIEHAADRTPLIDQAQSLNIFIRPDIHKRDLHLLHYIAWKKGVKSLYYCRSEATHRAENVSHKVERIRLDQEPQKELLSESADKYEECLACS
jgi:ribonucleoside-diphosphate reductase alpha chain